MYEAEPLWWCIAIDWAVLMVHILLLHQLRGSLLLALEFMVIGPFVSRLIRKYIITQVYPGKGLISRTRVVKYILLVTIIEEILTMLLTVSTFGSTFGDAFGNAFGNFHAFRIGVGMYNQVHFALVLWGWKREVGEYMIICA
jgi:hypothetical protein